MKCPKCGYTSFDYLDSCKKCNNALGEFKTKYGLRSLLFPNRTQQTSAAAPVLGAAVAAAPLAASVDSDSTDFGYDFDSAPATPLATPGAAAGASSDSFDLDLDWDAPATAEAQAAPIAQAEDDPFDFMADSAEPTPCLAAVGDELDLDLGQDPAPLAAPAGVEAFEFEDSWGESAADPAEETLPEFAAESFDFAESSDQETLRFDDEFDFSDEALPDLAAGDGESPATEKKLGAKEGPSDPFDQRESALVGPTPAGSTSSGAIPEHHFGPESPLDPHKDQVGAESADNAAAPFRAEQPTTLGAGLSEAEPVAAEGSPTASAIDLDPDPPLETDPSELLAAPVPAGANPAGTPFFRLGAGAFDLLLLLLIYGLFLAAGKLALFPAAQAMAPLPLEALADLAIPYFLILFALCFGYFTLFHFLTGQTPGKMIFRLKVESASGAPIDLSQAFLRSVGGLISLLCAGIGFLAVLRPPEHRSWSDHLAGTRVIETTQPPTERG